jgi:16S rRNA (guanine1516-N2)-methyltransferase
MSSETPEKRFRACAMPIRVEALSPEWHPCAARLAESLSLPLASDAKSAAGTEAEFALQVGEEGLRFAALQGGIPTETIRADFVSGAAAHRRLHGGGARQMIARAAGLKPGIRPSVLDATAGLGRDAFVLASLGCTLTLVERQPIVAALLEDALRRARDDPETAAIAARMRLIRSDATALMRAWRDPPPEVVYLDPMFPPRSKTAQVKKEMRLFRPLADDGDSPALLEAALTLAPCRVVVKRPRMAPPIAGAPPGYTLEGRACRFDIYPLKSLSKTQGHVAEPQRGGAIGRT